MGRKVYFLLNNFEQYNNKTYPVQKGFSPWLSYNPLGWGVTLVLCTVGLLLVCRRDRLLQGGVVLTSVAGLYAGGVLLFFVSDRFRLPLLPFLCVGAGSLGLISLPEVGQRISARILPATVGLLLASVLTFSRFFGVHDLTPAVQDYVALSIAYGKAGDDLESLRWARKALAVRRDHPGALASAVNAFYNCNLRGIDPGNVFSDESWQLQVSRAGQIAAPPVSIRLVTAVALWKVSRPAEARLMLRGMLEAPVPSKALNRNAADDALGVLLLSGLHDSTDEADARARAADTRSFYLLAALARRETAAQPLIPPGRRNTVAELAPFVAQLFPEVRPSG